MTITPLSSATTGEGAPNESGEVAAVAPPQPEPADTQRARDRHCFRFHGNCGQRRQRRRSRGDVLHPRAHTLRPRKTTHTCSPSVPYVQAGVRW